MGARTTFMGVALLRLFCVLFSSLETESLNRIQLHPGEIGTLGSIGVWQQQQAHKLAEIAALKKILEENTLTNIKPTPAPTFMKPAFSLVPCSSSGLKCLIDSLKQKLEAVKVPTRNHTVLIS
jgi:hypothetical protein